MRFLHTGDWHVGKAIRGRSRMDEFERALDQVVGIAVDERADAVLIAGDLYEHRSAAPDADRLVFETLLRLHGHGIPWPCRRRSVSNTSRSASGAALRCSYRSPAIRTASARSSTAMPTTWSRARSNSSIRDRPRMAFPTCQSPVCRNLIAPPSLPRACDASHTGVIRSASAQR